MLCYSLAKHARFCEPWFVTFSLRNNFFVEELVEDNLGKLVEFLLVKDVDLIQSNLKSEEKDGKAADRTACEAAKK